MAVHETVDGSKGNARLEVREAADTREVALTTSALSIGRAPECEIVLGAAWVAARHARLALVAGAHHVIAERGARVMLGGHEVVDAVLHDGDVVALRDPGTGAEITMVYRNPQASRIAPVHHFATPPGTPLLTIGRTSADIVLDQALVSRHHADLLWEDGHHVLRDMHSANGTFVNGVRVEGSRKLAPHDVVQIGTFRLTYDGDSLDSYDQRGAIRLDATAIERKIGDKQLLAPTTLSIEPCEFVAIVGGSGAGKSTLMTALCGFNRASAGRVTINGDDLYAGYDAYRSVIGYVPQDDILHHTLTVERALHHAAKLRLPADTTPGEIDVRIATVLDQVEMTDHSKKRIDQLSGGQRKRVSIACELLADPLLLFLDEPTSGLDPGLERKLMITLRKLADSGRTIVLITHATANIRMCDHIAFLAEGKLVYFGPPQQALQLFGAADFPDLYEEVEEPGKPDEWTARYGASLQHQKYVVERPARAPAMPSVEQRAENERRSKTFAQSRLRQLGILTRRYLELMFADRKNLALLLLQAPIIGVLLVLVSRGDGLTSGRIEAKKLIFMLATTGVWFGVINSAREICKEANVLRRERLAGLHAGPYVLSKLIVLTLLVMVQAALLIGVVAISTKLPASGVMMPASFEIYLTIVAAGVAGISLGLCVSAIASSPDKATSLIPIVLVPQVLFAGIMFGLKGPTAMISNLVSARAAVDAMSSIVDINNLSAPMFMAVEPQYAHSSSVLLAAWGMLLAQAVGYSVVAWLTLRRRR
ncbi:MAG: ATP-binding cassette domain-containing protein [Deltaproteobacteria bacterium]|nr:ATP-binding cassette domain-containing protein [Deltaproteobacteria bacterium]